MSKKFGLEYNFKKDPYAKKVELPDYWRECAVPVTLVCRDALKSLLPVAEDGERGAVLAAWSELIEREYEKDRQQRAVNPLICVLAVHLGVKTGMKLCQYNDELSFTDLGGRSINSNVGYLRLEEELYSGIPLNAAQVLVEKHTLYAEVRDLYNELMGLGEAHLHEIDRENCRENAHEVLVKIALQTKAVKHPA